MTTLSTENLKIIAAASKECSEIAIERRVNPWREDHAEQLRDIRERTERVSGVLATLVRELGDPNAFTGDFKRIGNAATAALSRLAEFQDALTADVTKQGKARIDAAIEGLRADAAKVKDDARVAIDNALLGISGGFRTLSEATAGALDELAEDRKSLTSAVAKQGEEIRARAADVGDVTRKVAEEISRLNEAATATLSNLHGFQERTSSELNESLEERIKDTTELLRVENLVTKDEIRADSGALISEAITKVESYLENLKLPDPVPGEPGAPGASGAPGEPGEPGPPGRDGTDGVVTRTTAWRQDRYYGKHSTVTHLAGLWQAVTPGDEEPGDGGQWVCLSRGVVDAFLDNHQLIVRFSDQTLQVVGGVQGPPGREWIHKGTFDPKAWYTRGDVCIVRGSSYVAIDDSPSDCPGDGWQMVAQAKAGPAGKPGKQGKAGEPGPPGPVGPPGDVLKWRGSFSMGETYYENDICAFGTAIWIALQETMELPKADGINWDLMIRAGGGGGGGGGAQSVIITQSDYDALSPPNPNVIYNVIADDCTP